MTTNEEVLKAVQAIAVAQAVTNQKIDTCLSNMEKLDKEVEKLNEDSKKLAQHDFIIKSVLWVYAFLITTIGYKLFPK